jgi:hypothetical protein
VRIDASMETAVLEKNIADINRKLDRFAEGTKEVFKGLGVGLSIRGLEGFVSQMGRLAAEGQKIQSLKAGFQSLGGSFDWVSKAQSALKGTVDDTTLLINANKLLIGGLRPTGEQFAQVAEYGARYAQVIGVDAADGIERVTQAISKGKPKQLEMLGFHITGKTRAEAQAQAVGQLADRITELPPIPDSVDTSFRALVTTLGDARQNMGETVNKSDLFKKGLNALSGAIKDVDIDAFGRAFGRLAGLIAGTTGELIKFVDWLTDPEGIKRGFDVFTGWAGNVFDKLTFGGGTFQMPEFAAIAEQNINDIFEGGKGLATNFSWDQFGESVAAAGNAAAGAAGKVHLTAEEIAAATQKADQSSQALATLQSKLLSLQVKGLEGKLTGALQAGDFAMVEQLKPAYEQALYEGQMAGLAEYIKKAGPLGKELADQVATAETQAKLDDIDGQLKERLLSIHGEAVSFWVTAFENAITGETFNLEDAFKQLAIGFAAELAAQVSEQLLGIDFFKGITSLKEAGGTFAQYILGGNPMLSFLGGGAGGEGGAAAGGTSGLITGAAGGIGGAAAAGWLGSAGMSGSAAYAAGLQGPVMANGMFASGSGVMGAVSTAMPYIAAAVAAYYVADRTGLIGGIMASLGHGETSPGELARREFSSWITEQFNKLSTAAFIGPGGQMVTGKAPGFQFDVSDKDIKRAEGYFAGLGSDAQNTFSALGTAFKRLAGLTEEQSQQIAAALAHDLLGNIDNARLLVYQLGLSFEDLSGVLLETAKSGEIRWSEYNAQIAGLKDAFEPGLKAVGDYGQAFQNLINSGGRGMAALKAVQDTAVEGMEAGMSTVDDLAEALKAKGLDPEWVDSYVSAIKSKGINTLEELNAASDETLGGIVGDMEGASQSLSQSWQEMGEGLDELNTKLDELNGKTAETWIITHHVETYETEGEGGGSTTPGTYGYNDDGTADNDGDKTNSMARGGIVTRRMRAIIGEAGPEAIIPLRSANSSLLNSLIGHTPSARLSPVIYNIDARGAQRGVSREVLAALRSVHAAAVSDAVNAVADHQARGRMR